MEKIAFAGFKTKEAHGMNESFEQWLRSGDKGLLRLQAGHETYLFLRAEKQPGFDYLYCQCQFHENGLQRGDSFKYVGLYYDGLIYDAEYTLTSIQGLAAVSCERSRESLLEQLKRDVRAMVDRQIANDRRNLTLMTLADPRSIEALRYYQQYGASREAREAYLEGGELGEVGFRCDYSLEAWTEESLLAYISDPLTYAERETARYLADVQEDMLLQFLKADALTEAYQRLVAASDNPVHFIRAIMAAMNQSPAKMVTVTIRKNGEEFTFKTEAAELRRDCGSHYSTWNIVAADRRAFEKRFGRSADYTPAEILRITYGKRTLYEADHV